MVGLTLGSVCYLDGPLLHLLLKFLQDLLFQLECQLECQLDWFQLDC